MKSKMKKITVFALDDDPGDIEILSRYLDEIPGWEIEVLAFHYWKYAREELALAKVDVIFLDYLLGKQTGLEVLKQIRNSGDKRPVIMLTGQGNEYVAAETTRAGADDYLVKSELQPDMLRRAIKNALTQFELRRDKALLVAELQHAEKMKTIGTLAGGIAHDFNNMLNTIMGNVQLAAVKSKDQELQRYLNSALTGCKNMTEQVKRIVNFSQTETTEKSYIDLWQVLKETEDVLRHTLPKKVDLRIKNCGESMILYSNSSILHQMILDLCINAAEAMEDNGIVSVQAKKITIDSHSVQIDLPLSAGEHILLEVQDTGKGMTPEIRERIFEPFFTTKDMGPQKGAGLGLALIWQNVRAHNGHIEVDSKPGHGSTFRIYLPVEKKEP